MYTLCHRNKTLSSFDHNFGKCTSIQNSKTENHHRNFTWQPDSVGNGTMCRCPKIFAIGVRAPKVVTKNQMCCFWDTVYMYISLHHCRHAYLSSAAVVNNVCPVWASAAITIHCRRKVLTERTGSSIVLCNNSQRFNLLIQSLVLCASVLWIVYYFSSMFSYVVFLCERTPILDVIFV